MRDRRSLPLPPQPHRGLTLAALTLMLATSACTNPEVPAAKAQPAAQGEPASQAPVEAPAEAPATPPPAAPPKSELPLADIPIPDPPTAEELALLEQDPATLSPEDRKRRAAARYKKVMQDPNSPDALVIRQARAAIEAGQAGGAPTFHGTPRPPNPAPAAAPAP